MRSLLAYSKGVAKEEKLTLRIRANNSGDIYIPTAGYSPEGTQDCDYDWMVSIDGNADVEYSGTGTSSSSIRVGYGLTPLSTHTVIIKPKVEEYGWLRAFGYKGTSYASSLINIISDKSYKGYALSDVYSGDYFKAYQYYGCTNLINTDEELLPDTLEVIGGQYRYYEYYGCTSLVSNADERILKTVKVIGDNYRAYQYQGCTNINRIYMRAINWASVGNNYRLNQFDSMGNDRNPIDVYIEGGIEEGGNWGLIDSRVKNIYVYEGLVEDYQTKLSTITSSKIKKNPEWDNFEYEFIEYIALADSNGEIRMPVGGYSVNFTQDCPYDWYVSIDGGEPEEISGTGGTTYVSVGSGLVEGSEHRVVIKPKTISWGWGRAFGFQGTGAGGYIKELIHDSYKCYAVSRINTGNYYKYGVYVGCTNLINSYEKLPTSVEIVGDYYMKNCYAGCTGLITAFWEVMHKGCSIGVDYRHSEYTGCSAMEVHQGIAGFSGTYPSNYKYQYLSGAGNNMEVYITRYEALASGLSNSMGIANNKLDKIYCFVDDILTYSNNTLWSNITSDRTKWQAYYYGYICSATIDISTITLKWSKVMKYDNSNSNIYYVGSGGMVILPGDIINVSAVWSSSNGLANPPALLTQKLSDLGVNNATLTHYSLGSTDWNPRGLRRWKGNMFGYAYNRSDYPNYAYGVIAICNGGLSSVVESLSPRATEYHNEVEAGLGLSRNGQYLWTRVEKTALQYTFTTPFSTTSQTSKAITNYDWTSMEFSDDGMTMYLQNGSKITQYNLPSPRYVEGAVDSGKSKTVSGAYFNFYKGGVYTVNGTTVYKYE